MAESSQRAGLSRHGVQRGSLGAGTLLRRSPSPMVEPRRRRSESLEECCLQSPVPFRCANGPHLKLLSF